MPRNPRPATVPDPASKRPKSTARPNNRRPTTTKADAIEAWFARMVTVTDGADFLLACAAEERYVIPGLEHALLTHHVNCTTVRGWAALLVRVQEAEIARAEQYVYQELPECECHIAVLEASRAA